MLAGSGMAVGYGLAADRTGEDADAVSAELGTSDSACFESTDPRCADLAELRDQEARRRDLKLVGVAVAGAGAAAAVVSGVVYVALRHPRARAAAPALVTVGLDSARPGPRGAPRALLTAPPRRRSGVTPCAPGLELAPNLEHALARQAKFNRTSKAISRPITGIAASQKRIAKIVAGLCAPPSFSSNRWRRGSTGGAMPMANPLQDPVGAGGEGALAALPVLELVVVDDVSARWSRRGARSPRR
jgi:hypothetical protein